MSTGPLRVNPILAGGAPAGAQTPPAAVAAPGTGGPAPAAETLSDPTRPARGILTSRSQVRATSGRRPRPSLPPGPRPAAPGDRPPRGPGPCRRPRPRPRPRRSSTPPASGARAPGPDTPTRATERYSRAPTAARTTWGVSPAAWWRGAQHPMDAQGLGRSEKVPDVPRVLDLVQSQKQRRLPPGGWNSQQVLQFRVLPGGRPGHHSLVVGGPGQARLAARGTRLKRTPACRARARMSALAVPRLGLDQDLLERPGPAPERLQDRVAAREDQEPVRAFSFHSGPPECLRRPRPGRRARLAGHQPGPSPAAPGPPSASPPDRRCGHAARV